MSIESRLGKLERVSNPHGARAVCVCYPRRVDFRDDTVAPELIDHRPAKRCPECECVLQTVRLVYVAPELIKHLSDDTLEAIIAEPLGIAPDALTDEHLHAVVRGEA